MKLAKTFNKGISLLTTTAFVSTSIVVGSAVPMAEAQQLRSCDLMKLNDKHYEEAKAAYENHKPLPHFQGRCLDKYGREAIKRITFEVKPDPSTGKIGLAEESDVVVASNQTLPPSTTRESRPVVVVQKEESHALLYGTVAVLGAGALVGMTIAITKGNAAKKLKLKEEEEVRTREREARAREEGARNAQVAGITNTPRTVSAGELKIPNAKPDQNISVAGAIPRSQVPQNAATFSAGGNTYITQVNPNTNLLELMLIADIERSLFWSPYWMSHPWGPSLYYSPYMYDPIGAVIIDPGYSTPIVYEQTVFDAAPYEPSEVISAAQAEFNDAGGVVESHEERFVDTSNSPSSNDDAQTSSAPSNDGFQSDSSGGRGDDGFQQVDNTPSNDGFSDSGSSGSSYDSGGGGFDSGGGGGGGGDGF